MEYYVVGQIVRLTHAVYDAAGVLTNPATCTLVITLPDETTLTVPAPTNTGTGLFRYDYTTTQAGRHTFRWDTTSPSAPDDGSFEVHAASVGIISLQDAVAHLNLSGTDVDRDEELRAFLEATTAVIERHPAFGVGPCVPQTVVERHRPGRSLWLRRPPVLSLTSITPVLTSGTAVSVADVDVDEATGQVIRLDGTPLTGGPWDVTYRAGRRVISGNIVQAAKVILKNLWETQRGTTRAATVTRSLDVLAAPVSYSIPNRAVELLAADTRLGGFA